MQHPLLLSAALKTDRLRATHRDERAGHAFPGAWQSRFVMSCLSDLIRAPDWMEVAEALREATASVWRWDDASGGSDSTPAPVTPVVWGESCGTCEVEEEVREDVAPSRPRAELNPRRLDQCGVAGSEPPTSAPAVVRCSASRPAGRPVAAFSLAHNCCFKTETLCYPTDCRTSKTTIWCLSLPCGCNNGPQPWKGF